MNRWGHKVLNNHTVLEWDFSVGDWRRIGIGVELVLMRHCDHPGVYFTLSFLTLYVEVTVYDTRHKEEL
jgi:hypothetical protein